MDEVKKERKERGMVEKAGREEELKKEGEGRLSRLREVKWKGEMR